MNIRLKAFTIALIMTPAISYAVETPPEGSALVGSPQQEYFSKQGKVTVQQFTWHNCIHCYKLEPWVTKWENEKKEYINFERIPASGSDNYAADGAYYNYAKTMAAAGEIDHNDLQKINTSLFKITLEEKQNLTSSSALPIFLKYGIKSSEELSEKTQSFKVYRESAKSRKLMSEYNIQGVPAFVISGKYLVSFSTLQNSSPEELFSTINKITESEHKKSTPSIIKE